MLIRFLLVAEGASDRGLVPHLEDLCLRAGASEVEGTAPDIGCLPNPPGRQVADQVRVALALVPRANIVFVHRDADSRNDEPVRRGVEEEIARVSSCPPHVAVIPVQELEAWLLTDEDALRIVAMNPNGKMDLGLPPPSRIENVANPKERLQEVLLTAANLSGRRLKSFRKRFPSHRAILLERLDVDGRVQQLSAWRTLVEDVNRVVRTILAGEER